MQVHWMHLGMELTESLHWGKHVGSISAKAKILSAFLTRNLKGCPAVTVQSHCYRSLVRPVLEYLSALWDPAHQQNLSDTVEMVQRRTGRTIYGFERTTSASTLARQLHAETPSDRRKVDKLTLMYKIMNTGLVSDIPASPLLKPTSRFTCTSGQQRKTQVTYCKNGMHLNSS